MGELDGGGLSYLRREWEETQALDQQIKQLTKTIYVPQVNHGQVASGSVPDTVVENDIDAELSEEQAHRNYAIRAAAWLSLHRRSSGEVESAQENFQVFEEETSEFLQPFLAMLSAEQTASSSPSQ